MQQSMQERPVMSEPSILRLNLLRLGYAFIAGGLGMQIWPQILDPGYSWELQRSVVVSMLGAMGLMSLLGLRYPLRMLPVLFFEIAWKAIWLPRVALPALAAGTMDEAMAAIAVNCTVVVLVAAVVPWDYVVARFVAARGEPWRGPVRTVVSAEIR